MFCSFASLVNETPCKVKAVLVSWQFLEENKEIKTQVLIG